MFPFSTSRWRLRRSSSIVGRLPLRAPKKKKKKNERLGLEPARGPAIGRKRRDDSVADLPLRRPAPILPAIALEAALARAHAERAEAEPLRRIPKSTVTDAEPPRLRPRRRLLAVGLCVLLVSAAALWLASCSASTASDSVSLPSPRPINLGDANGRGLGFSFHDSEVAAAHC